MTDNFNWLERPLPYDDESLVSWQRRWAHENLLVSRLSLLRIAGCTSAVRITTRDIKTLAAAVGLDEEVVRAISPQDLPPIPALRKTHTRPFYEGVCPHCLEEGQYSRQVWSHVLATACSKHAVKLNAFCEECSARISHNRPAAHLCRCGSDLSMQSTTPASDLEVAFAGLLIGKVMPGEHFPFLLVDNVPTDIDLYVIGLVNHFCRGRDDLRELYLGKSPLPLTIDEAQVFLSHLFNLLSNWPNNFEERLRPYLSNPNALAITILNSRDGAWFYHVFKRYNNSAYQPVRTCAANNILVSECGLLSYRSSYIQSNATIPSPWIPIAEACKSLGVGSQRFNEGIDRGLIEARTYDSTSSHRLRFLRHEEIERLRAIQEEHVDATVAIELLQVSENLFDLIDKAGLIKRSDTISTPPVISGYIQRSALIALMNRLSESVVMYPAATAEPVVFLRDLNLRRTTNRERLLQLFRAIESGELSPVAHDGSLGIGGFSFERHEVEARVSSAYVERGLTLEQIHNLMSCHYDAVKSWVDMGILNARKIASEQGEPWIVDLKDFVQFLMTYAPLANQATLINSTSRGIASKLVGMGVTPISPLSGRGTLVRLSDLFAVLPKFAQLASEDIGAANSIPSKKQAI